MKYTVSIMNGTMEESAYFDMTKKEAITTAKKEANGNPTKQVFISWFRKSDQQHGYLNSDGDHAITGRAW